MYSLKKPAHPDISTTQQTTFLTRFYLISNFFASQMESFISGHTAYENCATKFMAWNLGPETLPEGSAATNCGPNLTMLKTLMVCPSTTSASMVMPGSSNPVPRRETAPPKSNRSNLARQTLHQPYHFRRRQALPVLCHHNSPNPPVPLSLQNLWLSSLSVYANV